MSDHTYKTNTDRPDVTNQELESYKNFDAVLAEMQNPENPVHKRFKPGNAGNNLFNNFQFTLKTKIIMSTSVLIISAFVGSLFFNTGEVGLKEVNSPKSIDQKITSIENSHGNMDIKKEAETKIIQQPAQRLTEPGGDIAKMEPFVDLHFGDNAWKNNTANCISGVLPLYLVKDTNVKAASPVQLQSPKRPLVLNNIKPLVLDQIHLEKLGFDTRSKELKYRVKTKKHGVIIYTNNSRAEELGVNNYDDNLKAVLERATDIYPTYITYNDAISDPTVIDSFDNEPGTTKSTGFLSLIPVLLKQSEYSGFNRNSDIVFWFKQTPALMSVLSDLKGQNLPIVKVNPNEIFIKSIQINIAGKQFALHRNLTANKFNPTELNGIKFLQLDLGNMEKLGFKFTDNEISFKCTVTGHGTLEYSNDIKHVGFTTHAPIGFKGKGQDFYPVFISDKNGVQNFKYKFNDFEDKDKWTDKYFLATIRKLVPIVVKQDIPGLADQKDVVFWFNVTPSFLALLPDTISHEMGKEYNKMTQPDAQISDTTIMTTCKYFDVCQLPLEKEYGVKIYPNPATTKLNLEFAPPKNDGTVYCTYSLTDLRGNVIRSSNVPWYGDTAEMDVADVKPGIYLVVYKLNTGEVITNKVMIVGK